jgi:hypothetical protein
MGLFTKYKENNKGLPITGSVVSQLPPNRKNTLFSGAIVNGEPLPENQIIQTAPKQDVNLGRVESSLFKKRQEIDEQRIKDFLKTPGGRNHKTKEVRLSKVNPVFLPGFDGRNPTRSIIADKVVSNSRLSGGGTFGDKFGLFDISDDGYIKYSKDPDKSKLAFLTKKYNLGDTPSLDTDNSPFAGIITGLENFSTRFRNFSNSIVNLFGGRPFTKEEMYSYAGGPGSDNGMGITTLYKYDPIQFDVKNNNFYSLKQRFLIPRYIENQKPNNFWYLTDIETNRLPSLNVFTSQFSAITTGNVSSQFSFSESLTIDEPRRFNVSPLSDNLRSLYRISKDVGLYKSGSSRQSISGYYSTKPISLWNQTDRSKALDLSKPEGEKPLSNYSSRNTDKLNSFYNNLSVTEEDDSPNPDLIPFKIEIIDLDVPAQSYYLYFKAFIDSFDDSFSATPDVVVSPGNPAGKIFKYNTFSRNLKLNFKVAAFSKIELPNIYKKLNRLAATTLPFGVSSNTNQVDGIRTVISKLTVGNWCNRLPGIITSVNFTNIMESPWDIDDGLPMMVSVNMDFQYSSAYEDNTLRPSVRSFVGPNNIQGQSENETILFGDNMFSNRIQGTFERVDPGVPSIPSRGTQPPPNIFQPV